MKKQQQQLEVCDLLTWQEQATLCNYTTYFAMLITHVSSITSCVEPQFHGICWHDEKSKKLQMTQKAFETYMRMSDLKMTLHKC